MVLQQRSPSKHNQILGKKQTMLIPHPKSTNYDDDAPARPLKRIKRKEDDDNSEYARSPGSPKSAARARRVVPDSDAESNDEDADAPDPAARTDLESALPPVETDKEAIEAYEIQRAAEEAKRLGQGDRLKEGKWVKGRSSIYVDAFNLALDTVLEEERHLFDEAEIEVFSQWRALDYEAQYLYVNFHPCVGERLMVSTDTSVSSSGKRQPGTASIIWGTTVTLQISMRQLKLSSKRDYCLIRKLQCKAIQASLNLQKAQPLDPRSPLRTGQKTKSTRLKKHHHC